MMATQLTRETFKYMGTIKADELPTSDELEMDAEKFNDICTEFKNKMTDWCNQSPAIQNSDSLKQFVGTTGMTLPKDGYDDIVQAVIDNVTRLSIFSQKLRWFASQIKKTE